MSLVNDRAWANLPVVQLFEEPGVSSEVSTQLLYGGSAALLETRQGWCRVQTDDSYESWLQETDVILRPHPGDRPTWSVKTNAANLYPSRSVKQLPRLCLPFEAKLQVAAPLDLDDPAWLAIDLLDGTRAFTFRGNLTPTLPRLTLPESLAEAHRFLGITYTWGGISSFGFDCSGLVQSIFRRAGHTLPRNAAIQAAWEGFNTPADAPSTGDVLFFGPRPEEIDHVGIALDRERFLHATTHDTPGVQISILADPHWQQRLLLRRRLRP